LPKYVKICRIKFNCSNANAAIRGDSYVLSAYIVRNKIYIATSRPTARERVDKNVSVDTVINKHFLGYEIEDVFSVGPSRRYTTGIPWESDLRMTALARAHTLVRGDVTYVGTVTR
jgi:hypothetical protein